ncbi:radical S-adenosyl methionine domain-containing protein 1 [Sorochytrium milnesiophthora]
MLALYIHYPYCRALCTYCAFNKYPISSDTHATAVEDARLRQAYVNETRTALRSVGNPRIGTIYFGGGTPSLASIQWFEDILNVARAEGQVDEGAEITVEANPAALDLERMADFGGQGQMVLTKESKL